MKTRYKYISFELDSSNVWLIKNNSSDSIIGYIEFYSKWKQHVFSTFENCVFNKSCLLDIIHFINQLNLPSEGGNKQRS